MIGTHFKDGVNKSEMDFTRVCGRKTLVVMAEDCANLELSV